MRQESTYSKQTSMHFLLRVHNPHPGSLLAWILCQGLWPLSVFRNPGLYSPLVGQSQPKPSTYEIWKSSNPVWSIDRSLHMDRKIVGDSTRTILVCHSNRSLVRIAQLNASRHGISVVVARDGKDLLAKVRGELQPDAIVLSDDLKDPSTNEIVKALHADPRLKGIHVIVLKGLLGNLGDLLKAFKRPPWMIKQ